MLQKTEFHRQQNKHTEFGPPPAPPTHTYVGFITASVVQFPTHYQTDLILARHYISPSSGLLFKGGFQHIPKNT